MMNTLDYTLWRLQYLAELEPDRKAVWVAWAVGRYVNTGRAGANYCKALRGLDDQGLQGLIRKGLQGSLDDESILRRVRKSLHL